VRFAAHCAGDILIPGVVGVPLRICLNFYRCFIALDLRERIEIFQELNDVTSADEDVLVGQILANWQEHLPAGTSLPEQARALAQQMIGSLRAARDADRKGDDASEALRVSLNQHVSFGPAQSHPGGNLPAVKLTPEQVSLGRLVVSSALAG